MKRIFGLPKDNRAESARFLADAGFDSVVVGVDETPVSMQPARDAGLDVWVCRAAFSVKDLPENQAEPLLARDMDGRPQRWFNSGCPNQPALRQAHQDAILALAESNAFTGFMLDGIRFASPNAGDAFFTCFCEVCRERAIVLNFDWNRLEHDVRAFREYCHAGDSGGDGRSPLSRSAAELVSQLTTWPGVLDWLRFRAACVTDHVHEIREALDAANAPTSRFQLGAYLFTPSLAPLVGQAYEALAPLLDVVSPMVYRTLEGDACLVAEWKALALLGLVPHKAAFTATDVGAEVARARALLPGVRLAPILQLNDEQVAETTRAAENAGATDLDYFVFRSGLEPFVKQVAGS
ncbi:MAG TPA: hypothetical protein VGW38_11610 [Chloroflexota bacterium]|nr:hypothetical protein [Chloroflexota bacterium]